MKSFRYLELLLTSFILFPLQSIAEEIDPNYKDDWLQQIYSVMAMNGSIQPDHTAVETGANEWEIEVKKIILPGDSIESLNAAWLSLLSNEHLSFIATLREFQPEYVPANQIEVTKELANEISDQTDTQVSVQKGVHDKTIRTWILKELMTGAGRANTSYYFNGKKKLDYFKFHLHDASSEVIGKDLLLIRGVKNVVVVRINYCHC